MIEQDRERTGLGASRREHDRTPGRRMCRAYRRGHWTGYQPLRQAVAEARLNARNNGRVGQEEAP